jgi:hypothetical protein
MTDFDELSLFDRMDRAVRLVEERVDRSTTALSSLGIAFAIGGSNATAIWIASVDESDVRQARNVELIVDRDEIKRVEIALSQAGFVRAVRNDNVRFIDEPDGRWRDAIELTFGGEQISCKCPRLRCPVPSDHAIVNGKRVLELRRLVEFQLARYRLDDRVDLHDMIDVGLVDETWLPALPFEVVGRLQELLDNPDG